MFNYLKKQFKKASAKDLFGYISIKRIKRRLYVLFPLQS